MKRRGCQGPRLLLAEETAGIAILPPSRWLLSVAEPTPTPTQDQLAFLEEILGLYDVPHEVRSEEAFVLAAETIMQRDAAIRQPLEAEIASLKALVEVCTDFRIQLADRLRAAEEERETVTEQLIVVIQERDAARTALGACVALGTLCTLRGERPAGEPTEEPQMTVWRLVQERDAAREERDKLEARLRAWDKGYEAVLERAMQSEEEARKAREDADALAKALLDVKQDIDVCDWRCFNCQYDPEMNRSDLALTVEAALAAHEEGK